MRSDISDGDCTYNGVAYTSTKSIKIVVDRPSERATMVPIFISILCIM